VAINDEALEAVTDCLNALVLQLVDINTTMSEIYNRTIVAGTYLMGVVDELRTLNGGIARVEDAILNRP